MRDFKKIKFKEKIIVANIKSAKKRIDTNKRQKTENKLVKSTLSTAIKNYKKALASGNLEEAQVRLTKAISLIDGAREKGILHKNNASRKVANLSAALYKAQQKANQNTEVKAETKKIEKVEEVKVEVAKEEKPAKKTTTKRTTKKAEEKTEEKPAKKTTKKAATK